MPLVMEKLSSTHGQVSHQQCCPSKPAVMAGSIVTCPSLSLFRPAKEDAMSALVACCVGYGREAMTPHLEKVRWSAAAETFDAV